MVLFWTNAYSFHPFPLDLDPLLLDNFLCLSLTRISCNNLKTFYQPLPLRGKGKQTWLLLLLLPLVLLLAIYWTIAIGPEIALGAGLMVKETESHSGILSDSVQCPLSYLRDGGRVDVERGRTNEANLKLPEVAVVVCADEEIEVQDFSELTDKDKQRKRNRKLPI